MKQLLRDNKQNLLRWFKLYLGVVLIILIGLALWLGKDVYALTQGVQDFEVYENAMIQNTDVDDIDHAYVSMDIDKITGSYAQYGKSSGSNTPTQVYYLMPLNDGAYFITIIANEDYIPTFDLMEQTFYDNIGKEDKTYQDKVTIEGGFTTLNEESKTLALEYITAYDETISDVSQIDQYMSPYAFVIGEVGNVSIPTIWFCFYVWIGLIILTMIIIILYFSNIWQRYLMKEIAGLSKDLQASLSDDYNQAEVKTYGKLGNNILYCRDRNTYHIVGFEDLIWLYKKEEIIKEHRYHIVYAYTKNGDQKILLKNESIKIVKDLQNDIFTRCPNVLNGYQDFVYGIWKKDPSKFYDQLKELHILPTPKPITKPKAHKEKEEKEDKDSNNKNAPKDHAKKVKERKVVDTKETIKNIDSKDK